MLRPNRIFAALCLASVITLAAYILWAKTRGVNNTAGAPKSEALTEATATSSTTDERPLPGANEAHGTKASGEPAMPSGDSPDKTSRQIFFRYNGVDGNYGRLAVAPYGRLDQPRFIETLFCEVAHVAGGRGICLAANRGLFTTYAAKLFDAKTFKVIAEFPLKGVPSRCRMSSDGKLAALTMFISRDGQTFSNKDFNFWGVTFTPDTRHFYATLSTNWQHFLIKGDIAKHSASVIHDNVECPSLSPDASRVAYKKRLTVDGRVFWQLHILDMKTNQETPLAEKRSVDDQLEWLDNGHVLYSLPETENGSSASTDIWLAAIDGASAPRLFLKKAYSPSMASLP